MCVCVCGGGGGGCMSVPMRVCTLCPVVTCGMSLSFSDCNHCIKLCDTFLASIQREISDEVQSPDLNFSQPDTVRISSDIYLPDTCYNLFVERVGHLFAEMLLTGNLSREDASALVMVQ